MKQFIVALFACAEVFKELVTEERARAYCAVLSNYNEDELVRACFVLMRTGQRFPLPRDFIATIVGEGLDVEAEASATFAHLAASDFSWTVVKEASDKDECVRIGVAACGGPRLMREGEEGFTWKRRAFVLAYKGARQREIREREQSVLPAPTTAVGSLIDRVTKALPSVPKGGSS